MSALAEPDDSRISTEFAKKFHGQMCVEKTLIEEVWIYHQRNEHGLFSGTFFEELKKLTQEKAIEEYAKDNRVKDEKRLPGLSKPIPYKELFSKTESTCASLCDNAAEVDLYVAKFKSLRKKVEREVKAVRERILTEVENLKERDGDRVLESLVVHEVSPALQPFQNADSTMNTSSSPVSVDSSNSDRLHGLPVSELGRTTPATVPTTPDEPPEGKQDSYDGTEIEGGTANILVADKASSEAQEQAPVLFSGLPAGSTLSDLRVIVDGRWQHPSMVCVKANGETEIEVTGYPAKQTPRFYRKNASSLHEKPDFMVGETVHVVTENSVLNAEVKKLLSVQKKDGNGTCHFRYSVLTEGAGAVEGVYEAHQLIPLFKGGCCIMYLGQEGPGVGVVTNVPSFEEPWTLLVEVLGAVTPSEDENGKRFVTVATSQVKLDMRANKVTKVVIEHNFQITHLNSVYVHRSAYCKVRELMETFKRKELAFIPIPLISEAGCFVLSVNANKTKHDATVGLTTKARKGAKSDETAVYLPSHMGCKNVPSSQLLNLLPPIMTVLSATKKKIKDGSESVVARNIEAYETCEDAYQMRLLRHGIVGLPLQETTKYTARVRLPFAIVTGRLSSADYGLAYNFCPETNKVLVILAAKCGPQPHKTWKALIPTGIFTELSLSETSRVLACVLPLPTFLCLFIPVSWCQDKHFVKRTAPEVVDMTGPSRESVKDMNKLIKGAGNAFQDIVKLSSACKKQKDSTQRSLLIQAMREWTKTVLDHAGIEPIDGELPLLSKDSRPLGGQDEARSTPKASRGPFKRPSSSGKDNKPNGEQSKKKRVADLAEIESLPGLFPSFKELEPYTEYFMREYSELLEDRNKDLLMALAHFLQNVTDKIRIYQLRNKHGKLVKPFHLRVKNTVNTPFLRRMEVYRLSYLVGCIAMRFSEKLKEPDVLSYLFDNEIQEQTDVLSRWFEFGTEVPSWFDTFYGQKPVKDEVLRLLYARAEKHADETLRFLKEAAECAAVGVSINEFDELFADDSGVKKDHNLNLLSDIAAQQQHASGIFFGVHPSNGEDEMQKNMPLMPWFEEMSRRLLTRLEEKSLMHEAYASNILYAPLYDLPFSYSLHRLLALCIYTWGSNISDIEKVSEIQPSHWADHFSGIETWVHNEIDKYERESWRTELMEYVQAEHKVHWEKEWDIHDWKQGHLDCFRTHLKELGYFSDATFLSFASFPFLSKKNLNLCEQYFVNIVILHVQGEFELTHNLWTARMGFSSGYGWDHCAQMITCIRDSIEHEWSQASRPDFEVDDAVAKARMFVQSMELCTPNFEGEIRPLVPFVNDESTFETTLANHPEIKEYHDPSKDVGDGSSSLSIDAPLINKGEGNQISEASFDSTSQQLEKKQKT